MLQKQSGFTLIEVLIAMTILVTALLGFYQLSIYTIGQINAADQRLMAMNYAAEGIEIVRNIRDGYVEQDVKNGWNDFVNLGTNTSGVFKILRTSDGFTLDSLEPEEGNDRSAWEMIVPVDGISEDDNYLAWNYFRRVIITDGPSDTGTNMKKVRIDIAYEHKGIEDSVTLTSYLGNISAIR